MASVGSRQSDSQSGVTSDGPAIPLEAEDSFPAPAAHRSRRASPYQPPDTRREVLITGHMDLVNRYAIGKDWWGHPDFAIGPTHLGLDYWPPDDPRFTAQRRRP